MWMKLQLQYDKDTKAIERRDNLEKEAIATEMMLSSLLNLPELYKRAWNKCLSFYTEKVGNTFRAFEFQSFGNRENEFCPSVPV